MKNLINTLHSAQNALKRHPAGAPEREKLLEALRIEIPAPVLAHFLRLVERGRPGVTTVRHGVCSGCHLRVASGVAAALARPHDLHLCDNCGSYLMLAPEEVAAVLASRPNKPHRAAVAA